MLAPARAMVHAGMIDGLAEAATGAGAATVGLSGHEGPVMRLTAIPVLAYALGAGAIRLLWTG